MVRFSVTRMIPAMRPLCLLVLGACAPVAAFRGKDDPLPSWNPGPARDALIAFVERAASEVVFPGAK